MNTKRNLQGIWKGLREFRSEPIQSLTDLENRFDPPIWAIIGFILVGGIGILDYLTGYELAFSLFYLMPILLIAWLTGRRLGVLIALVSALVWSLADVLAGNSYAHPVVFFWNTLIRLSFFVIVVFLLTSLKNALEHERELGRIDSLTGAFNFRYFSAILQMEVDRTRRYQRPFTVAYIDIDNFKIINDQYGHTTGDRVLRTFVNYAQNYLRKTDSVARLGGDEFAFLLPETGQEAASLFISRIQGGLLEEMQKNHWPVTFSIGVLSCVEAPQSIDEVVKMADDLMYSVKKNGKNAISYATFAG